MPPGGRRGRGPLPAAAEEEEEDEEGEEGDGGDPPAAQLSRGCEARIALCSREVVGVTSHPALAASGGAGDSPVPKLQPPPGSSLLFRCAGRGAHVQHPLLGVIWGSSLPTHRPGYS